MRLTPMLLVFALSLSGSALSGQTTGGKDDRWQATLDDGSYAWDIRLVRLDGESLVFRQADSLGRMPVGQISEMRLIRKSEARIGGEGGAAGGAMAALVGGDDEVYDMAAMDFAGRLRQIQQILVTHPPAE
jgi:hypothetical protein